jgi:hypothetical protein
MRTLAWELVVVENVGKTFFKLAVTGFSAKTADGGN